MMLGGPALAALGGDSGIVIPYAGKLELDGALVTGSVDFEFGVAPDAVTAAPVNCVFTRPNIPVTNGEFAVSIPIPVAQESCVRGKDVHLKIAVRRSGISASFIPLGTQRVTPVVAAATSGPGDFAVTGALVAGSIVSASGNIGALTANTTQVTGALSAGATTVTGNLSVSGFALVGFQYITCTNTTECLCPSNDGSTIVFGGVDCGSNAITSSFSATTNDNALINRWKAGCSGGARPNSITIGCARMR